MSISKRERYTEGGKEEGGREREREALTRWEIWESVERDEERKVSGEGERSERVGRDECESEK